MIRFESRRAGAIEVAVDDVLVFEPLPGFPDRRRFVLMEHAAESELGWLVSLDDPDLAFVVASPWTFFPEYDAPVDREHLAALGIERRDEFELLCLVSLAGKDICLNLAAPLLVNATTRRGLQVLSDDGRYPTRAPLPPLEHAGDQASESSAPGTSEATPDATSSPGA